MKLNRPGKTIPAALLILTTGLGLPAVAQTNQVIVWGPDGAVTNVPDTATNLVAIAGGDYHALGLTHDGHVIAWGKDDSGLGYTNVPETLSNCVSIAAGATHSLALQKDGTLAMWGALTFSSYVTNPPPDATNIVALAQGTGALHALVLRADGTVVDWGNQSYGLASIPSSARHIVEVAAGSLHALALRADGRIVAWGNNNSGQTNVPPDATNVVAMAAGEFTSAAIRADGTVYTWGLQNRNVSFSAFGPGQRRSTNAIDIRCCPHFEDIALMRDGSLGMAAGFTSPFNATNIAAIGSTSSDGLALIGQGPPSFSGLPVNRTVASGQNAYFRALAFGALPLSYQWSYNGDEIPGATNTVFVVTNAEPARMGEYSLTASNAFGTAALSNMMLTVLPVEILSHSSSLITNSGVPVTFSVDVDGESPRYQWYLDGNALDGATNRTLLLTNVQSADAGGYSVAVSNDFGGTISSEWQLGVAPILVLSSPANTNPFRGATLALNVDAVSSEPIDYQWLFNDAEISGATGPNLTLTNVQYQDSGTFSCRLSNSLSQTNLVAQISISDVADWGQSGQAIVPAGATNFLRVVSGGSSSFAVKPDGTVTAWGSNSRGQLNVPDSATNVVALATGGWHCLALRADGTVVGWGKDDYGETEPPTDLTNAVAVAAGYSHSLALRNDGTVVAWGFDRDSRTAVPSGLSNVVAIAAGFSHSLALRDNGTVVAWGYDGSGQTNVPPDLTNAISISGGDEHSLALRSDGTVVNWGSTDFGLADIPPAATNIVAIASGWHYNAALRADGKVIAWGINRFGNTNTPVELRNVVQISANIDDTVARIGDGLPVTSAMLSNVTLDADGISLRIPSQSGRVYRLEYKNSLADPFWTPLPLVAGTGKDLTLTDATATIGSERFYRVRRW